MIINVTCVGTRYTLEVFTEDGVDSFGVVRMQPMDSSPTVHELLLEMIKTQGDVEKLARDELKKQREILRREAEEDRAV